MTAGKKIPTEITISPPVTLRITKKYQNDGRKLPGGKFPGELAPATREFFPSSGEITPQGIFTVTNLQYGQSLTELVAQVKSYREISQGYYRTPKGKIRVEQHIICRSNYDH